MNGNFSNIEVFPIPSHILDSNNGAIINNELLLLGMRNISNNPLEFFQLTVTRLIEFYKFWPSANSDFTANVLRVISFGIMWPFVVAGIWLSRSRWRELMPIYLFIIIHTAIHAISWTMIRYRIPLDALFIIFAAFATTVLLDKVFGDKYKNFLFKRSLI